MTRKPSDWLVHARSQMQARWEAGDRVPLEHFLKDRTDISEEDALVLIFAEVMLRWDRNESPTPGEYARRFPKLANAIAEQFKLGQMLRDNTATQQPIGSDVLRTSESSIERAGTVIGPYKLRQLARQRRHGLSVGRGSNANRFAAPSRSN